MTSPNMQEARETVKNSRGDFVDSVQCSESRLHEAIALALSKAEARGRLAGLEEGAKEKDEAYRQRNYLVAALARIYPSGIKKTDIPGWSEDWHGCCFIDLPSGQISYHYHDSHAHLFADLPPYEKEWDGHDKETVHERLSAICSRQRSSI